MLEYSEYIFVLLFFGIFVSALQKFKSKDYYKYPMGGAQILVFAGVFLSFLIWGYSEEQKINSIIALIILFGLTVLDLIVVKKINQKAEGSIDMIKEFPLGNLIISLILNFGITVVYSTWRLGFLPGILG